MSESQPLDSAAATPPQPARGALGIIFLIVVLDLMGFGIIIPLLPFYVHVPQSRPFQVTLLFSVYSICQFIGAPILGLLSDRIGRKPVLVFSQVGSVAGYVLLGLATDIRWNNPAMLLVLVYISRVVDGFTGGNISTAQAYISDVTTRENRAKGMGMIGAAFGIGFSIGPFLGGVLGSIHVSIPAYAAAFFSALAALLTATRLRESHQHKPTEADVWLHPRKFAPVFRRPVLVQLLLISFFLMAAFVMMESTIGLFLNRVFGWHERNVGWYFGFTGLIIVIVQGGLVGRITKAIGEWPMAIAGPVLVSLGMLGLIASAWYPWLWVLLIAGAANAIGRSIYQPSSSSLISKFSDPREQGVVFGLFHGMGSLARVAGPLLAGWAYPLLRNTGQFALAAGIAVIMACWTFALRQPVPASTPEPARSEAPVEGA